MADANMISSCFAASSMDILPTNPDPLLLDRRDTIVSEVGSTLPPWVSESIHYEDISTLGGAMVDLLDNLVQIGRKNKEILALALGFQINCLLIKISSNNHGELKSTPEHLTKVWKTLGDIARKETSSTIFEHNILRQHCYGYSFAVLSRRLSKAKQFDQLWKRTLNSNQERFHLEFLENILLEIEGIQKLRQAKKITKRIQDKIDKGYNRLAGLFNRYITFLHDDDDGLKTKFLENCDVFLSASGVPTEIFLRWHRKMFLTEYAIGKLTRMATEKATCSIFRKEVVVEIVHTPSIMVDCKVLSNPLVRKAFQDQFSDETKQEALWKIYQDRWDQEVGCRAWKDESDYVATHAECHLLANIIRAPESSSVVPYIAVSKRAARRAFYFSRHIIGGEEGKTAGGSMFSDAMEKHIPHG